LQEIRRLDPVADHSRIVYLDVCFEFPWDTTRALELALFRTFAVPSIAALLDATGEFGRAAQKRYDDTDLILSTIVEAGYDSEEGKRAIRQMNRIHGRFEITNEDFLYVLSSFVFEPIRWNARFGWRPLIEVEKLATFEFWRQVGRRMAIREIPDRYEELERFNRPHLSRTDSNRVTQPIGADPNERCYGSKRSAATTMPGWRPSRCKHCSSRRFLRPSSCPC
jgi:ER-bound oxygenase mpaB/B'/Rubber oxygenase, catalytic domain